MNNDLPFVDDVCVIRRTDDLSWRLGKLFELSEMSGQLQAVRSIIDRTFEKSRALGLVATTTDLLELQKRVYQIEAEILATIAQSQQ